MSAQTNPESTDAVPTDQLVGLGLERVRTVGIVLVVLGGVALIAPHVAGTLVSIVAGITLLLAGLSKVVRIVRTKAWQENWEDVLLAVLAVVTGAVICARPLVGLSAITLWLVFYFAVSGIVQIVWWWRLRQAVGAWSVLLAGVATLFLALLIGAEWPLSGLWAVGTLVGVHLVFGGASLIALANAALKQTTTHSTAAPAA